MLSGVMVRRGVDRGGGGGGGEVIDQYLAYADFSPAIYGVVMRVLADQSYV
jgi:hypothetical protein